MNESYFNEPIMFPFQPDDVNVIKFDYRKTEIILEWK